MKTNSPVVVEAMLNGVVNVYSKSHDGKDVNGKIKYDKNKKEFSYEGEFMDYLVDVETIESMYHIRNITKKKGGKLPLNVKYELIDKFYIPMLDGGGGCCDNCGRLISNVAIIKDTNNKTSRVGFDCVKKFLAENNLISDADMKDLDMSLKNITKINKFTIEIKKLIKEMHLEFDSFSLCSKAMGYEHYVYFMKKGEMINRRTLEFNTSSMKFEFFFDTFKNIMIDYECNVIKEAIPLKR